MNKHFFLFFLLICSRVLIYSQSSFCSTVSSPSNCFSDYYEVADEFEISPKVLRVYFHVIRTSEGDGGVSENDVIEAFNVLNSDFEDYSISFAWDNCINYVDNDALYTTAGLTTIGAIIDGINIYIADGNNSTSAGISSHIGLNGSLSRRITLSGFRTCDNIPILTSSTHVITHEVGHILGLYHPFELLTNGAAPLDGSNCDSTGDCICDTAPSPVLNQSGYVDSNCNWVANNQTLADLYNPDVTNYMNYTNICDCELDFTPTQVEIMHYQIENTVVGQGLLYSNDNRTSVFEETNLSEINSTISSNWTFTIYDQLIVDIPYNFQNCTFNFGGNGRIKIQPGVDVVFSNNCVLDACEGTWSGIENFGFLTFMSSYINNAEDAIHSFAGSTTSIENSSLTNNKTGLKSISGLINRFSGNTISNDSESHFDINHTKGVYLGGINTETQIGGEDENRFENLGAGIECTLSPINLFNASFNSVGQSTSLTDNWAVSMKYGFNNLSFIRDIEIINCSQGILSVGSFAMVSENRTIDVYTHAVRAESGGIISIANNPNIYAKANAIYGRNLSYYNVKSNGILVANALNGLTKSSSVYTENNGSTTIFDNVISTQKSQTGIMCNMDDGAIIKDNTIMSNSSYYTRSIAINGLSHQQVECNIVGSRGKGQSSLTGIQLWNATDNTIACNQFSNLEDALVFRSTSPNHTILANEFQGGDRGLVTDAFLMMQPHHGNSWLDTYEEVDAKSSLSDLQNQLMQFEVTGVQGDQFFPTKIEAEGDWFINKEGINQTCMVNNYDVKCEGSIGSNFISPTDQLNQYCEHLMSQESLTCSQQWINDYQLFSMVKDLGKDVKIKDGSCLYEFMEGVDSTRMQVFYTVDSLFNSIDSTLSVQLDSAFDTERDSSRDSVRWNTIQTLFDEATTRKSIGLEGTHTQLDSIRQDTCGIVQTWADIYTEYVLAQLDSTHQVDLIKMDALARQCPEAGGQAVFLARSLMSDYNEIRYDLLQDCSTANVNLRSKQTKRITNDITLSPNPTSGSFQINNMSDGVKKVSIFSLDGVNQYGISTNFSSLEIVANLNSGIYFIVIKNIDKGSIETLKLFVD